MVHVVDTGRLGVSAGFPMHGDESVEASDGDAGPGARKVVAAVLASGLVAVFYARWWTGGSDPVVPGLPTAGAITRYGLPVAQYLQEIAGVAVVGLLFLRCLTLDDRSGPGHRHLARMAARWGLMWVVSSVAWIAFTLSDLAGIPVTGLVSQPDLVFSLMGSTRLLSETATLWVALLVWLFAAAVSGKVTTVLLAAAAAGALLPSALTGHAGHHNSEVALATVSLGVHIVAASVWVGGLLALIVHLRRFPDLLGRAVRRFSAAALVCVAAVGVSGLLVGVIMTDSVMPGMQGNGISGGALLDRVELLFATYRGQLILVKTAALVVLTAIGYRHRSETVGPASSGRLGPLLRLGAGELALMGATIGVAVVLSTTA